MNTFEITIQRKSGNSWPIVVEHSQPGVLLPLRSEGNLCLTNEDFQHLTSLLGQAQKYGTFLGQALLRDEVRDGFVRALSHNHETLRVLLFIEAVEKELRTLRWERLCAPIDGEWQILAINQRVPFSFYIPAITDRLFPPIGRRDLRALILVASPADSSRYKLDTFDVESTVKSVRSALGDIPTDVLATVDDAIGLPTLDELCTQLTDRTKQYTLLHFVSHGRVMDDGETLLYWAKADNTVEVVTATRLIERLRPLRGARGLPHFSFLCTCESASPDAEGALGGLGQRLVRDLGMPAVVAMTEKVTIKTAQVLTEKFYYQLRESGEVDSALHEATAALMERGDVTVPALFSRLGGRPLFSDQLDRELTNTEIEYGLEQLLKLLPERSPILEKKFAEIAQQLKNILGADATALSKEASKERSQVLEEVNNLCEEILDLNFHALALGQQPPNYDSRCPFLGLYPFRVENRDFFFGREKLITQLQQKLTEHNFLAVLGGSGSGKSSVVLAGLIPLLQEKQNNLQLAYMTPSSHPIEKLQTSLSQLQTESSILVIDQFEELFTLCTDEVERVTFIEKLLSLIEYQKVVITMRADFWGECAPYRNLRDLMEARQKLIGPMDAAELRKAMEMQAAQVGLRFEPGLSNSILDDVQGEPGAMPLLQHALLELWKRRHGRWLRSVEYEAIGGVNMAIAQTADDVYNTLSPSEQDQVKNIFIRLTRLDESAIQGEKRRDTRRRVWLDELVPAGSTPTQIKELVNRLAGEGARLVVTSIDGSTNREEVEVAHEALIRYWPRLLNWLDENRTNLQLRETIRQAALEWDKQQKDDNYLVHRGGRLDDAQVLAKQTKFLNQLEANYVNACVELRLRQEQEKEARRRREIRTAWGVACGSVVALIVTAVLGLITLDQKRKAEITKAEALGQYSLSLFSYHQELDALVEGIKAGKILKEQNALQPLAMAALQKAVYGVRERNSFEHELEVNSVALSLDGKTIASASNDIIRLWDINGKEIHSLFKGHQRTINSVAFSPNGKTIASASDDNTVRLWDLNGNKLQIFEGHQGSIKSVTFSPNGKILASASDDSTIRLWNLNGKQIGQPFKGHQGGINSVAFSPDGKTIASAGDDSTIRLWDLNGKEIHPPFKGHQGGVNSVAFSPDGKTLVSAGEDRTIRLWDINDKEKYQPFPGHEEFVRSVAFSPDGKTIASAGDDNTVRLWDLYGNKLQIFGGHQASVRSVIFSHDGKTLASASDDKAVKLWDLNNDKLRTFRYDTKTSTFAFSPNGKTLATVSDKIVKVSDLNSNIQHSLKQQYEINQVVFSPDGKTLATISNNNSVVTIWDLTSNKLQIFPAYKEVILNLVFSPDGKTLAINDSRYTLKLWDLTGKQLQTFKEQTEVDGNVVFSPDGKMIATTVSDEKSLKLWDLNGNQLQTFKRNITGVTSIAFSPDSRTLVTAGDNNTVKRWDLNGVELLALKQQSWVTSLAFSPDGKTLVTAGNDNTVKLWDLNGVELITLKEHKEGINSVSFSLDGKILITTYDGGTLIIRYLDDFTLEPLLHKACNWVQDYLKNNNQVKEKNLCDRIGTN